MNFNIIIKILTGLFIVPISISAHMLWPWWTNTTTPLRIISGVFILPITAVAFMTTSWWNGF